MTDPETNLAIARRITAAFEQGDDATLRELYAPDHVLHSHWHDPLPLPGNDGQPVLDRYQQADATARADETDLQVTVEEQIAWGDWVVTVFTSRWTHARRGTAVAERGIFVDRFANGKVAESWLCGDWLGLLQQLGAVGSSRELYAQADLTT
jgi:ketosteroid isomerase-like protein